MAVQVDWRAVQPSGEHEEEVLGAMELCVSKQQMLLLVDFSLTEISCAAQPVAYLWCSETLKHEEPALLRVCVCAHAHAMHSPLFTHTLHAHSPTHCTHARRPPTFRLGSLLAHACSKRR